MRINVHACLDSLNIDYIIFKNLKVLLKNQANIKPQGYNCIYELVRL